MDDSLLRLVEDVPHGVLMMSETQQLVLLVPNVKLVIDDGKLSLDRNDLAWEENVMARYFMYDVHVSKQFMMASTFASALYLCVIRLLVGDHTACFTLADSIATCGNTSFSAEEEQARLDRPTSINRRMQPTCL